MQIAGQLPYEAQPIKLISANNIWAHPFRIFGFPHGHNDGVWSTGVLRDGQGKGWVQLEDSKVTGYRIEPGFSGAPIWDETLAGVVGMAVAAEKQRENIKTNYFLTAEAKRRYLYKWVSRLQQSVCDGERIYILLVNLKFSEYI